ncbi:MAG: Gfo/Idh/MocA family protein [Anaerolineaceae bacterium]
MPKKPYTVLLIGAGNRGSEIYSAWSLHHPDQLQITAIAEPVETRQTAIASKHAIPAERQFTSWEEALNQGQLADAAIICTQDQQHAAPALKALENGYDVLLEKPMANRLTDCVALVQAAEQHGKLLQIAHVLRYTDFFQRIYQAVNSGSLGQIITVSHRENVSAWHMAHSYVRGNWRRADESSPMILAKSCHDLDILYWILGNRAKTISSVGNLKHFKSENAPAGAPQRCLDSCPAATTCPFYAPALYMDLEPVYYGLSKAQNKVIRLAGKMMRRSPGIVRAAAKIIPPLRQITAYAGWPRSVITDNPNDPASVYEALKSGPYGRCVYHCDNDVVDHQIVLMELENGVSVSFTMHGHSFEEGRTIRIDGSKATLLGKFGWDRSFIEIREHRGAKCQHFELPNNIEQEGHGGGDATLIAHFVKALDGVQDATLTDARSSLESHLMAFAAEQARTTRTVVNMSTFRDAAEKMTSSNPKSDLF